MTTILDQPGEIQRLKWLVHDSKHVAWMTV
jgi:hypothetical protein